MAKNNRTHISVKADIYEEARKIADEALRKGFVITMEEAFYRAKKAKKERDPEKDGWDIGGFGF